MAAFKGGARNVSRVFAGGSIQNIWHFMEVVARHIILTFSVCATIDFID